MLLFVLLISLIGKSISKCEKSALYVPQSQNYNVCEMCYFQFGSHMYFLKCQKKLNCKTNSFISDQYTNLLQEFFHIHDENCQSEMPSNYNTNQCEQQCCQHFKFASFFQKEGPTNIYTNQYCKEMADRKRNMAVLTVLAVSIPLICLSSYILVNCLCRRGTDPHTLAGMFGQNGESFIDENEIHLSKMQIEQQGPSQSDKDQSCAICLDDNCNAYTNCGHYYHPKCFREWLVKRPRCPVCMSKKYNPVKIYCKKCRKAVRFEIFKREMLKQLDLPILEALQVLTCCSELQQGKTKSSNQNSVKSVKKSQQKQNIPLAHQIDEEEHVSIIEFSEEVDYPNNKEQIQEKVSNTTQNIKRKTYSQESRHNKFDLSVKDYIRSFKITREKQLKSINIQEKNDATPKKTNESQFFSKETPNKLLYIESETINESQANHRKITIFSQIQNQQFFPQQMPDENQKKNDNQ